MSWPDFELMLIVFTTGFIVGMLFLVGMITIGEWVVEHWPWRHRHEWTDDPGGKSRYCSACRTTEYTISITLGPDPGGSPSENCSTVTASALAARGKP